MAFRVLAGAVIAVHSLWVLFMLYGFFMTVYALFLAKNKRFLDRWLLRGLHLLGIFFTGTLEVTGNYCPLTLLENFLNRNAGDGAAYGGPFLAHYIAKFVYPDINPYLLTGGAVFIAVFSLAAFVIRPPRISR